MLELEPDRMRELGYAVVDLIVDHLAGIDAVPLNRTRSRAEAEALLREPLPREGTDPAEVLETIRRDVFGNFIPVEHPRFFAYIPSPNNFVSVAAEALTAGFNPFVGSWQVAAGPAQVELVVVDWLRELCGLPASARGLFVSGGSMANLTALAVARHARLGDDVAGAVVYASDQVHSACDRALRVLGFADGQLRKLPCDERFRLDPATLRRAIEEDRAAGRRPFCVIATAGTTNTGAIDPLDALAEACGDLWLHVDGAYGAAAVVSELHRPRLAGIEHADSVALDPHKWLFQPYETGCLLVRDGQLLHDTFQVRPEYLRDVTGPDEEVNFRDYGIQLTRSFRALKLWMSLKVHGADAFGRAVDHGIALAEYAEELLRERDCWEVVTPAAMAIVCFRYRGQDNSRLIERVCADGYAMLSSTLIEGEPVFRLCTINPRTTREDIRSTLDRWEAVAASP